MRNELISHSSFLISNMDILKFLTDTGIEYELFEHEAIFTCNDRVELPDMPGENTKNLFLIVV